MIATWADVSREIEAEMAKEKEFGNCSMVRTMILEHKTAGESDVSASKLPSGSSHVNIETFIFMYMYFENYFSGFFSDTLLNNFNPHANSTTVEVLHSVNVPDERSLAPLIFSEINETTQYFRQNSSHSNLAGNEQEYVNVAENVVEPKSVF